MDPSAFQEREFALIRREAYLLGPMASESSEVQNVTA